MINWRAYFVPRNELLLFSCILNVFAALPHILFLYYNDAHQKVSHDVYNGKNALRCFDHGFRYSKVLIGRRHFMNDIGGIKLMIQFRLALFKWYIYRRLSDQEFSL